jgi:hypothetical protein
VEAKPLGMLHYRFFGFYHMRYRLLSFLLAFLLALVCVRPAPAEEQNENQTALQPQPAEQERKETQVAVPSARPYTSDGAPSVSLFYWMSPTRPIMRTGAEAAEGAATNLNFPRHQGFSPGAVLSLPGGGEHTVRISYFRNRGAGNTFAGSTFNIYDMTYNAGEYLSTAYTLQNAKVSLDYLSWPFPVREGGRLRVKTFWELQMVSVRFAFDAPFRPREDADGVPLFTDSSGSNWFLLPTLGVGIETFLSRNVRIEAKGSGFGLPDRHRIADGEAFIAFRGGQYEFLVGAKAFHFRTSPKQELFLQGTMSGAFAGMRWYPKW